MLLLLFIVQIVLPFTQKFRTLCANAACSHVKLIKRAAGGPGGSDNMHKYFWPYSLAYFLSSACVWCVCVVCAVCVEMQLSPLSSVIPVAGYLTSLFSCALIVVGGR